MLRALVLVLLLGPLGSWAQSCTSWVASGPGTYSLPPADCPGFNVGTIHARDGQGGGGESAAFSGVTSVVCPTLTSYGAATAYCVMYLTGFVEPGPAPPASSPASSASGASVYTGPSAQAVDAWGRVGAAFGVVLVFAAGWRVGKGSA